MAGNPTEKKYIDPCEGQLRDGLLDLQRYDGNAASASYKLAKSLVRLAMEGGITGECGNDLSKEEIARMLLDPTQIGAVVHAAANGGVGELLASIADFEKARNMPKSGTRQPYIQTNDTGHEKNERTWFNESADNAQES